METMTTVEQIAAFLSPDFFFQLLFGLNRAPQITR